MNRDLDENECIEDIIRDEEDAIQRDMEELRQEKRLLKKDNSINTRI